MSYVVHLWEAESPPSLHFANQLHTQLTNTAAAANPKFAQLARALIGQFPSEVGGLDEAGAAWVESPPDGQTDSRVYSLGLYDDGITCLLPVLVEKATGLGLTVYDDQAARVYLPGGWVLDQSGRQVLQAEPASTLPAWPTVAQARAMFKREVLPTLAVHGFKWVTHNLGFDFVRDRPSGEQRLTVGLRDLGQAIEVKPSTMVNTALPEGIALAIGPGVRPIFIFARHCVPLLDYACPETRDAAQTQTPRYPEFWVESEAQMQAIARAYLVHVQDTWLPLLDAIAEPPGMVQCDRHSEPHGVEFGQSYGMLGMAHWIGAPDFDAIVEAHAARMAATTMRGLLPVLREMAEKLKACPQFFGIYPRTDLT